MNRPMFRRLAGAATALLGLSLLGACTTDSDTPQPNPTGEAPPVSLTIGLTYTPDIQFAPWYLAEAKGYFEDAGLDVDLRHHGASESLFGALEAGDEDVVVAGGDEMLQARSQGVPIVNIATVYHGYPVALIVPQESPITAPQDLAGHTVGIPGPFGETWFGLLALLADAGLTPEDVTIEHIGFTQQAALTAGHVDAIMGFANNDAVQFELADQPVRVIPLTAAGEPPLVGIGLGASEAAIAAHPEELRAIVAATQRAIADIVADPAAAVEISADYIPGLESPQARTTAQATLEATVPLYESTSDTDRATQWQEMAEFMAGHELLGDAVDAAAAVTDDFLP